jgi:hypothetical protein
MSDALYSSSLDLKAMAFSFLDVIKLSLMHILDDPNDPSNPRWKIIDARIRDIKSLTI